ncbi:NAD-dependent epimerase/dehydratase family protein [Henriciella algicola]|uniref:NAD-dependent epimerase/dehydratase family protein n=1 Tax=Henriciella algicola TaxID=1608422 RepID=A0A399RCB4_9PROT|nr:NAD-dependent epimerase/dehydratase family protein [Henriciella algicola]RIJ29186.1 NAD-dependent epimerase/dehydratase family protein [Henriciella algicola]
MRILITGAVGFLGMHTASRLNAAGHELIGIDNFNDYYDPQLKHARHAKIRSFCKVHKVDLAELDAVKAIIAEFKPNVIVHLAAQAGVRYSMQDPMAYVQANVAGHTSVLEACRILGADFSHLVYASSSSVYGGNRKIPFSESDEVNDPVSIYAATKRAGELLASTYAHLFRVQAIGLRFFTVYGPWGRPDMAYWSFTRDILAGTPIRIFNHGKMMRDFTYIDDVVDGILAMVERSPTFENTSRPHRVYNIGNNNPEKLMDVVGLLETLLGKPAVKEFVEMQSGDVVQTYAEIEAAARDYGFSPSTSIELGLSRFVAWYKEFHGYSGLDKSPDLTVYR